MGASELWDRILEQARLGLPEQSFRTWLSSARAASLEEGVLEIEAPTPFHAEWLEDKFGDTLRDIGSHVWGSPLRLRFSAAGSAPHRNVPEVTLAEATSPQVPVLEPAPAPQPPRGGTGLNERYTFERFVVGNDNQLAQAASQAAAKNPARTYNPLFLYGGTGLGKTHLMHAIGNEILDRSPEARICYVPTEQFTNEMVTAIREGRTPEFRARYRAIDLLLVDDVQFLEGKERTQEEFFHTFNALYDAGRQIVLTSDRHPKELGGLEGRLVSRFEWGLVADVNPPDYETRVAILRKKADEDEVVLDPDVLDLIARSCESSVRELEGAIIKLLAFSSLTRQELTMELAETALASIVRGSGSQRRSLRPESIRDRVAEAWGVSGSALASKRRTRDIMVPRQVAMYLIKEFLDLPLQSIGEAFGGRDHSTVIHSLKKVEERLNDDPAFRGRVDEVRKELAQSA
ncbi:MAG: chromosomal replication initiator protein DnaA [Gemmatimonadetes bacterium]|nr:chromosomal replication initiator protein DnaA [Gemmatimonadota bacterium]